MKPEKWRPSVNKIWAFHLYHSPLAGFEYRNCKSCVIKVADEYRDQHGNLVDLDIRPGDLIYHTPVTGTPVSGTFDDPGLFQGKQVWVFSAAELMGIDRLERKVTKRLMAV